MKISICYDYRRGNKSGEKNMDKLPDRICRHHIISYHRMYYLGILALCYLKKRQITQTGGVDRLGDRLKAAAGNPSINIRDALGEIIYDGKGGFHLGPRVSNEKNQAVVREQNRELYKAVNELAWLPMNTFSGPFESLRHDDPSQKNDGIPCGMPEAQRAALQEIMAALDRYSHSFIPHEEGQGGVTQCVRFQNEEQFNRLAEVYLDKIKGCWRRYESKISDWRVATSYGRAGERYRYQNKTNYYRFYFDTGKQRENRFNKENYYNRVILGDFVLKNREIRESTDKKAFKILSVKRETKSEGRQRIQGVMVDCDAPQNQCQDRMIKDFF